MHQTELSGQFQRVLEQSARRVQLINYVLAALLLVVIVWAMYAGWRNSQQEKIESITLVPGSVRVDGPTALCPGDTFAVTYALEIDGVGVLITDDSLKYANHTVKFSTSRREIIDQSGTRTYEDSWVIPAKPDMTINGKEEWVPGLYVRFVSIAASNIYVSRYTDPVWFQTQFMIKEGC
jgi:hypothetical protein